MQSRSDGVNTSLFEKREHIEKLHRTRNLLRKVQVLVCCVGESLLPSLTNLNCPAVKFPVYYPYKIMGSKNIKNIIGLCFFP